ncbi:dehydrogenase [Vibrio sp. UCD-FRSSP16_10]|uniref:PQQ-dependent sugar dehydrogenase n=1 Tax=unclassified Vibrio TaxID=2614977 RepID=UPI000800E8DC|nr:MULTISPECIES: PQQ-dependent sugar dehydrogenase [unclassified Vibrio]OBT12110.1 dehydrogenase [Vibrio sp. UCD-FRSSP16_30]OBT20441.1 dehydrogenase [Vibrio sp. UCD-FRSSP16_10]
MTFKKRPQLATLACALFGFSSASFAYQLETVATGLSVPWSIEFVDSDTALVSERNDSIVELDIRSGKITPLYKPKDVYAKGQGGLLDLAFHPQNNSQLFITYSQSSDLGATTSLASATYKPGAISQFTPLLTTQSHSDTGRHFGSRIVFDDNNMLYFSVGDRGVRDNGQDLSTHAGSILRISADGSTPSDNPFIKDNHALAQIWSYGHRNPQGLTFDHLNKQLWAIEHGPRGGDEINKINKGHNYGWSQTSHGKEYWGPIKVGDSQYKEGVTAPALVYTPSIAPSSLILYRGKRYPKLNGKLLAGALKLTHINVVSFKEGKLVEEQRLFEDQDERIRDIQVSPDDYLYVTTDSGKVMRLLP